MKCNKCNYILPDDSEFCQYCGNKITGYEANGDDIEGVLGESALNLIVETQHKATKEAYDANSQSQPNNENDFNFGLVPEKPIYTLAKNSVDGEIDYLSKLRMPDGEKVKWNRRGSTSVEGINGLIDIYDIYLLSGQKYKTIYINMYGVARSVKAPEGFILAGVRTATVPKTNGNDSRPQFPTVVKRKQQNRKLVLFTNICAIVLSIISMSAIFIAMNVQDSRRNQWESWNPTNVYVVLLLILGIFLGFAIHSLINRRFKLLACLSTILLVAAIVTGIEDSIMSWGYYDYDRHSYKGYVNRDTVEVLNIIWIVCVVLIFLVTLIPVIVKTVKKIKSSWYQSILYREKCYKRVAKIHKYLERGILTEEEYEKTKRDILKHI